MIEKGDPDIIVDASTTEMIQDVLGELEATGKNLYSSGVMKESSKGWML